MFDAKTNAIPALNQQYENEVLEYQENIGPESMDNNSIKTHIPCGRLRWRRMVDFLLCLNIWLGTFAYRLLTNFPSEIVVNEKNLIYTHM